MRHIAVLSILSVAAAAACTPHAYTPSARPMPLSTAQTPMRGESDVQVDGHAQGEIFGPGIFAGNVRYRRGVKDNVALVGDVGLARVDGENMGQNPYATTARAGVQVSAPHPNGDFVAAGFAGAGGGYAPTAGGWASVDVGGVLTGTHRYVRPVLLVDLYGSQPIGAKTFMAYEDNIVEMDDYESVKLPRTLGAQGLLGFDLGPRDRSAMIGFAFAQLYTFENDVQQAKSETFFGLGGGFRFGAI